MVEIACPHCSEELELPNGTFGEFECPICQEEFVWGQQPVEVIYNLPKEKGITKLTMNIVALWNGFILLFVVVFIFVLILNFLLE
mgnify:CR=1 FL=1